MSRTRHSEVSSQLQTASEPRDTSTSRLTGTLRLRGDDSPRPTESASTQRIRWSEDVVDNEGMGRKSSKVCCIYHKSRPVGESSSESDSSESSSSDSDSDSDVNHRRHFMNDERCPRSRGRRPADQRPSERPQEQEADVSGAGPQHVRQKRRKPSPNAYEKMPKSSKNQSRPT